MCKLCDRPRFQNCLWRFRHLDDWAYKYKTASARQQSHDARNNSDWVCRGLQFNCRNYPYFKDKFDKQHVQLL